MVAQVGRARTGSGRVRGRFLASIASCGRNETAKTPSNAKNAENGKGKPKRSLANLASLASWR